LRRLAGDRVHVTLVVAGPAEGFALDALRAERRALAGVAVNRGDPRSSYAMGSGTRVVAGGSFLPVELPRRPGGHGRPPECPDARLGG
jgi:hypothetical protein